MYHYISCFGCLMVFNMHFYIIFGTNLLTEGPVQIAFFSYFSVSQKRNIKRNPNGMKPSRGSFWNKRNPGDLERKSGTPRGIHKVGGCAQGVGSTPHPHGGIGTLLAHLRYSVGFLWSKNKLREIAGKLDSVWFSFSATLKNKEKTETGTGL